MARVSNPVRSSHPIACFLMVGNPLDKEEFVKFLKELRTNSHEFDCEGRVLRLKRYIPPGAKPAVIELVLEALMHNTRVEVLYIQNFEHGFFDQQLESLMKVLKLRRIWGLNVGENFGVSIPAWRAFSDGLHETAVSHMYASEHHFRGTDLKRRMRAAIRINRAQQKTPKPPSIEAVMECGNMWYNPKLPSWARAGVDSRTADALFAKQQAASQDHERKLCASHRPSPSPATPRSTNSRARVAASPSSHEVARGPGKRSVVRTEKALAYKLVTALKEQRHEWKSIMNRRKRRHDGGEEEEEDARPASTHKRVKRNQASDDEEFKPPARSGRSGGAQAKAAAAARGRRRKTAMPVRFADDEFEVTDLPVKAVRKAARKAAAEEEEKEAQVKPPVKRRGRTQSTLKAKGGVRKRVLPKREPPKTPRPRAGSRCGRIRRR